MSEISSDLEMYFNKLIKTIETQASFSFGNKKIVNKTRIDDILCCIDVNFPEILKHYLKEYGTDKHVHCFRLYEQLISNIKINVPLSKDNYAVNYNEVLNIVPLLKETINADVMYVKKTYTNIENTSN